MTNIAYCCITTLLLYLLQIPCLLSCHLMVTSSVLALPLVTSVHLQCRIPAQAERTGPAAGKNHEDLHLGITRSIFLGPYIMHLGSTEWLTGQRYTDETQLWCEWEFGMVNFTCQVDRATGCPEVWSNTVRGVSVFPGNINIWLARLTKKIALPNVGGPHLISWRPE